MNKENSKTIYDLWLSLIGAYEEFSRPKGISYVFIVYLLYSTSGWTQNALVEKTLLPKQTVHSIITSLYKDGLVTLQEMPNNRRNKVISLTDKGQEYASKLVTGIIDAEQHGFDSMTQQEADTLVRLYRQYTEGVIAALRSETTIKDSEA